MHVHTTTTYGMLLQHDEHSPQKKATLTSKTYGALQNGKRSHHQKEPALTTINGAHLLKWLFVFCMLDSVDASINASHGYTLGSLVLTATDGSLRVLSEVLPTCECSAEIEAVSSELELELDTNLEANIEAIRQFICSL